MTCQLEQTFGALAERLPATEDGPEFVLNADNLPKLPPKISTTNFYIKKGVHYYGEGCRYDALLLFIRPPDLRVLGLAALSRLFHPGSEDVTVEIQHSQSDIRRFIFRLESDAFRASPDRYFWRPHEYRYWPHAEEKHPFLGYRGSVHDLPWFSLSNEKELVVSDEHWAARDSLFGLGTDRGYAHFGEFCLNAGCPSSEGVEYAFEGEPGYRSVAPTSAEFRVMLPGSDFWDESEMCADA